MQERFLHSTHHVVPDVLQGDGHLLGQITCSVNEKQGSHLAPLTISIQAASPFTTNKKPLRPSISFFFCFELPRLRWGKGREKAPSPGEVSRGQKGEQGVNGAAALSSSSLLLLLLPALPAAPPASPARPQQTELHVVKVNKGHGQTPWLLPAAATDRAFRPARQKQLLTASECSRAPVDAWKTKKSSLPEVRATHSHFLIGSLHLCLLRNPHPTTHSDLR